MSQAPTLHAVLPCKLPAVADARPTAVVYCEANFGLADGKTANGLVRHSERYRILSVIDSRRAGADTGRILGDGANGIPVVLDLAQAIRLHGVAPDFLIVGVAPASGMLSSAERQVMLCLLYTSPSPRD